MNFRHARLVLLCHKVSCWAVGGVSCAGVCPLGWWIARASMPYLAALAGAVGHADRRWPLEAYVTGLLLPGERKSVEPMAARMDPAHVSRAHQALHHFVADVAVGCGCGAARWRGSTR